MVPDVFTGCIADNTPLIDVTQVRAASILFSLPLLNLKMVYGAECSITAIQVWDDLISPKSEQYASDAAR